MVTEKELVVAYVTAMFQIFNGWQNMRNSLKIFAAYQKHVWQDIYQTRDRQ